MEGKQQHIISKYYQWIFLILGCVSWFVFWNIFIFLDQMTQISLIQNMLINNMKIIT